MKKTAVVLAFFSAISFAAQAEDGEQPKIQKVAMTFDDGPSDIYTPQILAILKEYSIKATFFVVGRCVRIPVRAEVLRQVYADGHLIANHTYRHKKLTKLTNAQIIEEIKFNENLIQKTICGDNLFCNYEPAKIMRPPGGATNERVKTAVKNLGYKLVKWNITSNDGGIINKKLGFMEIVKTIFKQKRKDKENVLMHDAGGNRTYDVKALPHIINEYKKMGYEFVTVDEL